MKLLERFVVFTPSSRRILIALLAFYLITFSITLFYTITLDTSFRAKLFILGILIWAGMVAVTFTRKWFFSQADREVLYYLPITLEALMMLMHSGMAIIPAIREVGRTYETQTNPNIVGYLFSKIAARCDQGISLSVVFAEAHEATPFPPLKHVLSYMRSSAEQGGSILPTLAQLVEHTHKQWGINTQSRVKRLEALVVFPVFTAVMGLMLLCAAVPSVPIIELMSSMEQTSSPMNHNNDRAQRLFKHAE